MNLLDQLSTGLLTRKAWIMRVIARAPYAYKTYYIPKKSKGIREISQPAKETKRLQYWVIENILSKHPIHQCAFGYVVGKSIKLNAKSHVKNRYLAKFDIVNFFPSIKERHVRGFLIDAENYSQEEITMLSRILLRKPQNSESLEMTIGAPSSPMLSNVLLYDLDKSIFDFCKNHKITYTRYADDMTFSTNQPDILFSLKEKLDSLLTNYKYGTFKINDKKTIYRSKRNSRQVTGIYLTNESKISLGRDRKRHIRTMIHYYKTQRLDAESTLKLQGLISFAQDVEPSFVTRMRSKYSSHLIDAILSFRGTNS